MDETQRHFPQEIQPSAGIPAVADFDLVAEVLRKDRKATADFVSSYVDQIYRYVEWRLIPRLEFVDDIVQDIFLAAWENLSKFRGESSLQTWMFGIARHKIEDHYRGRLREAQLTENEEDQELQRIELKEIEDSFDQQESASRVREILMNLPEAYSVALLWRYWEKRSIREIASETGKTEKAIERLLARARNQFRKRWNERHNVPR